MNPKDKCPEDMWEHDCPIDGPMCVGKDEECNWCGATEDTEEDKYK